MKPKARPAPRRIPASQSPRENAFGLIDLALQHVANGRWAYAAAALEVVLVLAREQAKEERVK